MSLHAPTYYEVLPWFWDEIDQRREVGSNSIIIVIGPNNWGKSWWAIRLAEEQHERWKLGRFTADFIVFNAEQFWQAIRNSPLDGWIVWDEPNKGLSNRKWWDEMNLAVTTYIQTMRFKRKNLLLALPHDKLIDKAARAVLLCRAKMLRPGLATIEQIQQDYYGTKEYYTYGRGEVELYAPSKKLRFDYNIKKDQFHENDYPEEAFTETKPIVNEKSWQTVKNRILEDPTKFQREVGKGTNVFVLSSRLVSYELGCSDNTARRAIYEIEKKKDESKK